MARGRKNKDPDPYLGCSFAVEIRGLIEAGFSEVSGLSSEVEVEEYREGGFNHFVHQLPKGSKFGRLVLKRGFSDSETLWKWHLDAVNGKHRRYNVWILLRKREEEKWKWICKNALPVKWTGPDFKADGNAIAIESLELVHEGIEKG